MTELEAKAKDCIENHTHKLVDKPTKQDLYLREESIFISGYKLGTIEATKELQEKINKIYNYLANEIPHEMINEATNKIWKML